MTTKENKRDCKHGQLARSCNICELEAEVAQQAAEIERLQDYDTRLSAVMPADFKDWHENSKREWPELAALVITNLREREAEANAEIERKDALLRQALEAMQWEVGGEPLPTLMMASIAAIKQHLEDA